MMSKSELEQKSCTWAQPTVSLISLRHLMSSVIYYCTDQHGIYLFYTCYNRKGQNFGIADVTCASIFQ